ncbi:MAG: hypothetical protein P8M73_13170 [Luminiphilus sp.]|jgi:hypothetical protein|nr:hypothetical protein [Luminiphilus sp.]
MEGLWLYVHILLLVFWVGTDVGVFIAAKWSERTELSIETRQTVLQLGMVLDRLPRSALTLIIPSGCQLAVVSGWLDLSGAALGGLWAIAAIWLAILWRGFLSTDPKTQEQSAKINWVLNLVGALIVSSTGIYLFTQNTVPDWLALKILAVGAIFCAGVLLDLLFKPAVDLFIALGSTPDNAELNGAYSRALSPVYIAVLAIYAFALIAAALGIFK